MDYKEDIFGIRNEGDFRLVALEVFRYQYRKNRVYHEFCRHLNKSDKNVKQLNEIPYLPIQFFKSHRVVINHEKAQTIFTSSGTTGSTQSKHYVSDLSLYEKSFLDGFKCFYGDISRYCVLALLPTYLERQGSSLIYMVNDLIRRSTHSESGFYLNNTDELLSKIIHLDAQRTKVLLIGVSFALLDMAEKHQLNLKNTVIMETGGMKGRKKEMVREELHKVLKRGFGVDRIHSEYGMTELLSQAYSNGNGIFKTPPWMGVGIRDTEDPLVLQGPEKTGGINIIDLANVNSCSFIATQDLGKIHEDGSFEVLGRFDHSDIRGCNLMVL